MDASEAVTSGMAPNERTEPASCPTHGPYEIKVVGLFGREIRQAGCPACSKEREAERAELNRQDADRRRDAARAKRLEAAGITPRFQGKTLEAFRADAQPKAHALQACQALICHLGEHKPNCPSLILCGKPGTGKSHLASGMIIALADAGFWVLKINASDLIRSVRATWGRNADCTESEVYQQVGSMALLIIDEVGVQSGTDNEKLIMFEVINRRYEACLPTVLISNLPPEQIMTELGDRIMDRLREDGGRMIPFEWQSERRGAA